MPHIALVSTAEARATDDDLSPLQAALEKAGASVTIADWHDMRVKWSGFDLAVLRSCWDYTEHYVEFLIWAERVSLQTRLLNPFEVVRWNTDKHYLAELEKSGIAIVPSAFIEPHADVGARIGAMLDRHPGCAEFVVKPAIGAGSRDTQRHARGHINAMAAHIARLLKAQRSVMLQPYLDRVDEVGETALIHFDGAYSHSIRKGALLRADEGPTDQLYAPETIEAREPSGDERALALRVLAALPFKSAPAYARVDLIRADDGSPVLLELELAEPSLFFNHCPGSAERFARTVLAHCMG
ncbi:MAG TPA: hypothetical protein PKO40_03370 [Dokdonella sp.]|jgi:glutathione synthase/RimK-type ligase-like ATP-grasp enzyme|uniref:ATP-grasp domain-containing protein n=1 Tax=Dokdonella sp. TaxID=2291710 RepID=UPI001B709B2D|nr:hypothetical protein [Dokdonella sp.]MBP6328830.1 hypothetical protein [Dokdonella sp.]HNV07522.1 hypothetical protein [Dokdonella sp.]HPW02680.1 hypothetical protein [Dokdonella sp.]